MVSRDVLTVELPFKYEIVDNQEDLKELYEPPGTIEKESKPLY